MKASTLLMALALLAGAAGGSSSVDINLNEMLALVPQLNHSVPLDTFVEDVMDLGVKSNYCGNAVFCKVQDILQHKNFSRLVKGRNRKTYVKAEEKFMKNLEQFLTRQEANCTVILKNTRPLNISRQMSHFWSSITNCIYNHNLNANSTQLKK